MIRKRITRHQMLVYCIEVQGHLDGVWGESFGMTVAVEDEDEDPPVSSLTGVLDQAGLHGVLRRLYALRLPLILVECREPLGSD